MTSSKDSPIYFVLTFFTQRSHLFCFVFWWMHMIVYMPSGHGCACTSTFMHMHGVWRTTSGMLLLRYYLVSVWQESLTDLGLTWFSWPALLANSGDPLRYLQDNKDLAPHLAFFFFFFFINTRTFVYKYQKHPLLTWAKAGLPLKATIRSGITIEEISVEHGGVCLQSQHLAGESQKVKSS